MPLSSTLLPALFGLGTGLALIVAIGSQNAYLLRLAVSARIRIVALAVLICAVSDALLILAGVLGVGAVIERVPGALLVVRFLGAAFLITYGVLAARRALRPSAVALDVRADPALGGGSAGGHAGPTLGRALGTMLALTWLNPHVYLDTVVFLGSVANQQGVDERWWWVGGAVCASALWFSALGFGARLLRPIFARPGAWRVFDALIAVIMLGFGAKLLFGG
ncbi:LysE/ArgO family amino acid transporter [Planctomonas psychrotolerans]|uniref:LysE/ArgO family amino acid transporter n=1 Tax=Planctomonas psychrotolerans TaxID=2528712 RepID=UPI001D0CFFD0|nr:LysE family transporter [Planctomonas psychrotolerans]